MKHLYDSLCPCQKEEKVKAEFWRGKGYEKGQTQPFWIGLLKVLGVADPERGFIEFEDKAHIDAAYGFSTKMTESECVAELFKRYQALVGGKP